ncbi:MAG: replicative DNA helicase [Bacteriovoracaceae bacterium]|nr:replicative DNA helicase [Bacteriovoracaceae bacterium]
MIHESTEYFDYGAERAVLASILLEQSAIYEAQNIGLKLDDFHHPKYKLIYEAMEDISQSGGVIEPLTVTDWTIKRGRPIPQTDVIALFDDSIGSSFIIPKVQIIKERSMVRQISEMGGKITEISKSFLSDPKGVTDQIEKLFISLSGKNITKGFELMNGCVHELLKEFESGPNQVSGILTGFPDLDSHLNGMRAGQMIVLAARPSVGKTSLALNICQNVLKISGRPVAVVSLEMPKIELVAKIMASEARVSLRSIQNKDFRDDEMRKIGTMVKDFSKLPLYIDDQGGQTIYQIQSKLRKLKMESGLGFVCIDYLGLVKPHSKYSNKADQVAEISMMIKALAKELEIPILVLAQLNREAEKADNKTGGRPRPALHNLRDSGSIEQDADVVMFIDRDKHVNPEKARVLIAKNRAGEVGDVSLRFIGHYSTFLPALKNNNNQHRA